MTTIAQVSGTAFVVAEFRVEENFEPVPLYIDPIVWLFLDDESQRAAARVAAKFPLVKDLVKIRTKYFDDTLDKQLRANVRQVLILGSGLDTRAIRQAAPGVTYFEIDDPETIGIKRARYEEFDLDLALKLIPGNYINDGLIKLLDRSGFDFDLSTYIIWEGNTMYLPLDRMKWVMNELGAHLTRFRLSFDYMADAVISRTTGDAGVTRLVESFADMGAPWLSGVTDIGSLAREVGLSLVENFPTSELYRAYRPDRPITSPIFDFYSVCTVGQ